MKKTIKTFQNWLEFKKNQIEIFKIICHKTPFLFGFYGISNFFGYLMPNPFLYELTVIFLTIQFSVNTQFNCQNHFYFKLFILVKQF